MWICFVSYGEFTDSTRSLVPLLWIYFVIYGRFRGSTSSSFSLTVDLPQYSYGKDVLR